MPRERKKRAIRPLTGTLPPANRWTGNPAIWSSPHSPCASAGTFSTGRTAVRPVFSWADGRLGTRFLSSSTDVIPGRRRRARNPPAMRGARLELSRRGQSWIPGSAPRPRNDGRGVVCALRDAENARRAPLPGAAPFVQTAGLKSQAERASRRRALCWKNSAWLMTAETLAGWNGLAMRKAGSGRSPVRKRSG